MYQNNSTQPTINNFKLLSMTKYVYFIPHYIILICTNTWFDQTHNITTQHFKWKMCHVSFKIMLFINIFSERKIHNYTLTGNYFEAFSILSKKTDRSIKSVDLLKSFHLQNTKSTLKHLSWVLLKSSSECHQT